MKTYLPDYECLIPSTVEDALAQRQANTDLIPIAGGTDVLVWMNFGFLPQKTYQSLHRLKKQWRYVREDDAGGLRIGALATYTDVRHHPAVKQRYSMLVESARVTGALQIQNRGTLAGNIANGSPAADTVPALMVYDARLVLLSAKGEREIDLADFFTGYKQSVLQPNELIREIILPPVKFNPEQQYYRKVGTREAQAISKVVFAAGWDREKKEVRLALGSVAPTTIRAKKTEAALAAGASKEEAWKTLQTEISPIDDVRSTRDYRIKVCRNLLWDLMG